MQNTPKVKAGIITVSRACFPIPLSESRRAAIAAACPELYECKITVENEKDMLRAVEDVTNQGVNALIVFLGNFGPETPETLIAKYFDGPVMYAAAAEDSGDKLMDGGRGDAYCGMLNCSYDLQLRNLNAYIPPYPVGTAKDIAQMVRDFIPLARAVLGISALKIITFGPRPDEFLACNAPLKGLYDLGVEVQENSDLDLYRAYRKLDGDPRIAPLALEIKAEMSPDQTIEPILTKLAQYQLTLTDWAEATRGASDYIVFATKCWPSFAETFGFVPCYINSRMASLGYPIACETDIYGAFSEYIAQCVTEKPVTLLDINNSVPQDLYDREIVKNAFSYRLNETFMGFHCGNTPNCHLINGKLSYQRIMKNGVEPDGPPDVTRGTIEGDIKPGPVTFLRVQGPAEGGLVAYIAQGEVLPVATRSFGSIGIVAIKEMDRFYRHVLIEDGYPHHSAVAFGHAGKILFELFKFIGVDKISYNQPKEIPYPTENPFI